MVSWEMECGVKEHALYIMILYSPSQLGCTVNSIVEQLRHYNLGSDRLLSAIAKHEYSDTGS